MRHRLRRVFLPIVALTLGFAASTAAGPMEDGQAAYERGDYAGYLKGFAVLKAPVDAFFDKVTVNADDAALRVNRLKLLAEIGAAMGEVADFSKIEG